MFKQQVLFGSDEYEFQDQKNNKENKELYQFFEPCKKLNPLKLEKKMFVRTQDSIYRITDIDGWIIEGRAYEINAFYVMDILTWEEKRLPFKAFYFAGTSLLDLLREGDLISLKDLNGMYIQVTYLETCTFKKTKEKKLYCERRNGKRSFFPIHNFVRVIRPVRLKPRILIER